MARSLRRRAVRLGRTAYSTEGICASRIRMVAASVGILVTAFAHPVGAGQTPNASLPYDNAQAYLQSSETVWETVEDVADAWGLKTDTKDRSSQLMISQWTRLSDFDGSPFFQSVPTLTVDGVQFLPVEFQLHVFVSPFVEPARVHGAAIVRVQRDQNQFVHYNVGFVSTEFFRELEKRLGETGATIPVASASRNPCLTERGVVSRATGDDELEAVRRLTDFNIFPPVVQAEALVLLDVTIGFDGAVTPSRVVSVNGTELVEPDVFARAAEDNVSLWRYQPAERDDCPVSVMATVAMNFGLVDSQPVFYGRTLSQRELGPTPEPIPTVYEPGAAGVQNPRLLKDVQPSYPSLAMRQQVEGEVWLEMVVLPDGTVGDVRVTKSLDMKFGLDVAAVIAAKQWRFEPGTRDGEPVAVLLGLVLEFHLK